MGIFHPSAQMRLYLLYISCSWPFVPEILLYPIAKSLEETNIKHFTKNMNTGTEYLFTLHQ